MTRRTMQMIARELFGELEKLETRAPGAIGRVGINGVDGAKARLSGDDKRLDCSS